MLFSTGVASVASKIVFFLKFDLQKRISLQRFQKLQQTKQDNQSALTSLNVTHKHSYISIVTQQGKSEPLKRS